MKSKPTLRENPELIQKAKNGDDSAKTELLRLYRPLIDSLTLRFSANLPEEERDDLTQEATIAFFRALEQFDAERKISFGTFAKVCIFNRLTDYLRKQTAAPTNNAIPFEEVVLFGEDDILKHFCDKESLIDLFAKFRETLSDFEYRIWMLHISGHTAKEIAKATGQNTKSIENALTRARIKIRKNLPPL